MRTTHRSHIRYAAPIAPARRWRPMPVAISRRIRPATPQRIDTERADGPASGGIIAGALVSLALWLVIVEGVGRLL